MIRLVVTNTAIVRLPYGVYEPHPYGFSVPKQQFTLHSYKYHLTTGSTL